MKAALFIEPGRMDVVDTEKPKPSSGEILIRVKACAICGTDLKIYSHGHQFLKPPQIIGHEVSGVIEEIGDGVSGYEIGDRVFLVTPVGCGKCSQCIKAKPNLCIDFKSLGYHFPGGFAEYMLIPSAAVVWRNVIKIPINSTISFNEASLVEPLSCAINGQDYLDIRIGDTVAILGAGAIGCMHAELAKIQKAGKVILINSSSSSRMDLAKRFNADVFVTASETDPVKKVLEETSGTGADVVIVACAQGIAQEQAIEMCAILGRISLFGGLPKDKPTINFNSNTIHYKEISVFGAFASYHKQYIEALNLLAFKKIDGTKFITHTFPLEKIKEGIETAKKGEALKVIINP